MLNGVCNNIYGGKGIRTPGLLIANETLYQLSYTPDGLEDGYLVQVSRLGKWFSVVPGVNPDYPIVCFSRFRVKESFSAGKAALGLDWSYAAKNSPSTFF